MARRRSFVPPWLLLFTAYAVLGLTWLMTTPPWASPDEPSALAKGISVTHGHLLGREPDYRYDASSFIENWYRKLTRTVDMPARQMPPALLPCYAFGAGQDASCLDKEPVAPFGLAPEELATHDPVTPELFDIRLLVARLGVEGTAAAPRAVPVTYLGTYQPFVFGAPAVLAFPASTPTRALYLARLGNLLGSLALIGVGLRLLARSPGTVRWLGAALALTPMALFSAATFSSSGLELAAAFCHVIALLEWFRERSPSTPVRRALLVSALVLASARTTGPAWLLAFDVIALLAIGVRAAWMQLAPVRRWAITYASTVGVAVLVCVAWQAVVQPRPPQDIGKFGTYVHTALTGLGDQLNEQIGVFGWLDTSMSTNAYRAWFLLVVAVAVAALVRTTGPGRALVIGMVVATVAAMIGVAVLIAYPVQGGPQGRWTLPVAMALPLVTAALIDRRATGARWPRWACVGGVAVVAVVQLLALWTAARRYAVSVHGDWWFSGASRWSPPLGWGLWVVTAIAAGALLIVAAFAAMQPAPESG